MIFVDRHLTCIARYRSDDKLHTARKGKTTLCFLDRRQPDLKIKRQVAVLMSLSGAIKRRVRHRVPRVRLQRRPAALAGPGESLVTERR
jgi:hypothetical protein